MNGDDVVYECLRKHGSDEEGWRCLRRCGTDNPELQEALREHDAEEAQTKARQLLRKFAVDEVMEKARQKKATLDSIAESPVWKHPAFLRKLSHNFMAADLEKSRETTKHYIDSTGQPARAPCISKMGNPKRGADGRLVRDARGEVIWDTSAQSDRIAEVNPTSAHLRKAQQGSLQNCGQCASYNQDKTCQIVTGPVASDLTCDKFTAIPAKPLSLVVGAASRDSVQRKNVMADGRIDLTKSVMGNPVRNPDGSWTWVAE
jgi:hypothetical protein